MKAQNRHSVVVALIAIALLMVLLAVFVPSRVVPVSWDFQNNLWGPAHLLLQGSSPYNIKALFPETNAVWMPMAIGLFLPLGALPVQWASNLWLLLNFSALATLTIHPAQRYRLKLWQIALIMTGLVVFPPTLAHLQLGQISLLVCLGLYFIAVYRQRMHPALTGLILAAALLKPQLLVLYLPLFLWWTVREQGWRKAVSISLFTVGWVVVLCLPLFILYPNWIPDLLSNLAGNNSWFYPSLYALVRWLSGSTEIAAIVAGVCLVAGVGLTVAISGRVDAFHSLLWSLALTPIFSPIIWSWDYVLLFPLVVLAICRKKSRAGAWFLYTGLILCMAGMLALRLSGVYADQYSIWAPVVAVISIWASHHFSKEPAPETV